MIQEIHLLLLKGQSKSAVAEICYPLKNHFFAAHLPQKFQNKGLLHRKTECRN